TEYTYSSFTGQTDAAELDLALGRLPSQVVRRINNHIVEDTTYDYSVSTRNGLRLLKTEATEVLGGTGSGANDLTTITYTCNRELGEAELSGSQGTFEAWRSGPVDAVEAADGSGVSNHYSRGSFVMSQPSSGQASFT